MSPRLSLIIQLYSSPRYAKLPWCEVHTKRQGEVNGLPGLRGHLVAHCEGLALLETELGEIKMIHKEWFKPDVVVPAGKRSEPTAQSTQSLNIYEMYLV